MSAPGTVSDWMIAAVPASMHAAAPLAWGVDGLVVPPASTVAAGLVVVVPPQAAIASTITPTRASQVGDLGVVSRSRSDRRSVMSSPPKPRRADKGRRPDVSPAALPRRRGPETVVDAAVTARRRFPSAANNGTTVGHVNSAQTESHDRPGIPLDLELGSGCTVGP